MWCVWMIIIIYIYTVEKSVEWGQFLDIMNSEIDPLAVFLHTVYTQNKQNKTSPCLCELLQALLPLEALIADDPGGKPVMSAPLHAVANGAPFSHPSGKHST